MTNEEFLQRYDSGKPKFTTAELGDMAYGLLGYYVDTINGKIHKRFREVETIFGVGSRLFAVRWDRGLNVIQQKDFYGAKVYEVVKKEKITFEWVRKEDETHD